ncbi:LuxR C-terminal-related transcriptional regulator [Pirellulaceae bacterium SH449]
MCSDQPLTSLDGHTKVLLTSPQSVLMDFFDSPSSDFFAFTYDVKRQLIYRSGSMQAVFGGRLPHDTSLSFHSLLTDHRLNQSIKDENEFLSNPGETLRNCCELGYAGVHVQVELRRQIIIAGGHVVGVIGVGIRVDEPRFVSDESLVSHTLGITETTLLERWRKLSPAEIDVVEYVSQGLMNKVIAKNLSLAVRTVEARRSRILRKLEVSSIPELVRFHMLVKQILEPRTTEKDRHEKSSG